MKDLLVEQGIYIKPKFGHPDLKNNMDRKSEIVIDKMSACMQVGEGDLDVNREDNRDQRDIDVVEEVKKANRPPDGF